MKILTQLRLWAGLWVGVVVLLGVGTSDAFAGGFALQEQSVRGLGQSFAGATTGFGDGSSAFFNPAATLQLSDDVVHFGAHVVAPSADFDNDGSSMAAALGGGPVSGNEGGNGGEPGVVPNIYVVKKLADGRMAASLSVNSPFGLVSEYNSEWVGRYHAVRSELLTVNINPSVAVKLTDWLTLGAGVSAMYADAELTNAIDLGTVGFSALGPSTATSLGLLPQQADGFATVTGDDWGYGYNAGALVTHGDTKVGVHYRSRVDLTLEGDADFDVPANAMPLTATGSFVDTGARAAVDLPETVQFDVSHELTDQLTLAFGALWTHWSRVPELRVQFDSAQSDSVVPLSWDNTWRLAAGLQYAMNDKATFSTGVSWEESPIKNGDFRTPRIPDNDRWWLTFGVSVLLLEDLTLDLSYAHIFVVDAGSNVTSATGDTLKGEYDLSVDIASAALTWHL